MKEIMAIIRTHMVNKTKEALINDGYPGITCRKVYGRGKRSAYQDLIEQTMAENEISETLAPEEIIKEHRLLSKRLFTLIVKDEDVKKTIHTIIRVNQTGNPGDGKIFVFPVSEVIRVRTGEHGENAI